VTTLSDLLSRLDADPGRRGKQFEHICKWFLTHDPVYARDLRQVWLWKEWPGRWSDAEAGIDLVAEDGTEKLWAIQAKCYAETETITKRELNKFLSESARAEFSLRLLIATTELVDRIAERTMEQQEKAVRRVLRHDLEAARVDWPPSPSDLLGGRLPPNPPWPHQEEAVTAVVEGLERVDRGQLIMACGTGKTLTALFIHEKLGSQKTLVLVPSLSLLEQTLREWASNSTLEFDFLPVCSDDTVADDDAAVLRTSDLGFRVTTKPEEIAAFLRRSGTHVVFATYQSSPEIAKVFRLGRVPAFDLVVADEAHRCVGPISSAFRTVLDADAIRARRRLFMTATPRYFTGRVVKEAKEEDFEVASMDNTELFGEELHRFGFRDAIERKRLTDYQVVVVGVDDATYRDWAQRGRFVTRDGVEVTDARTLAGQIGLAKAMRRYDLRRTITFHSRIKRARDFANSLKSVADWMPEDQRPTGELWCDYASGEMPAGDRRRLLQRLGTLYQADRGILANARCLAEGVDVPTLDGVAFIDPRRSEVDIVQAVGRAIRLDPDKVVGTIVIPVFIDTAEDPEIALNDSAFKPVWAVIKALRAHDDWLGEQLDELRRELGRQGQQPRLPAKIHLDLPVRVGIDFARAFEVTLVQETTASWEFSFGVLERFVERNGHACVPTSDKIDGYPLGGWVTTQRHFYAKGILDPDRACRLQALPRWTWDAIAEQWEEGFRRLLRYVELNGHARPGAKDTVDGYPIGRWVITQRHFYAKGTLPPDREDRLQGLPDWTWDPRADQWEEGFRRLLRFVELNGHAGVAYLDMVDGYAIGKWVDKQRQRRTKGRLEPDRESRLLGVRGWTWDTRTDQWDKGFRLLVDYVEQNGDARVSQSHTVDGYPLGKWVKTQRNFYRKHTLDADCQARLERLRGWTWDPYADQWEEGFRRLLRFVEINGHARVPRDRTADDPTLGTWVSVQRRAYAKGSLEPDRQSRLQALPDWTWDARADKWEEGFRRLLRYVELNGHACPGAKDTVDGYPIGRWVITQRHFYAKGTLPPDREDRLQGLPDWTWDATADRGRRRTPQ
jgi:superfamily II DNA or RNA helicase